MNHLFLIDRGKSHRQKKPRGALRKVHRAATASVAFDRVLDPDDWFDYWHQHLDWEGLGNRSMQFRHIFFAGYARLFRHFALQGHKIEKPYQLWIFLSSRDAGQDAVYLHTPNPNGDSHFPEEFRDVRWGLPELTARFSPWLPGFSLIAGRLDSGYIIFAEGYGVSPRQEAS